VQQQPAKGDMMDDMTERAIKGSIVFVVMREDNQVFADDDCGDLDLTEDEQRQVWREILLTALDTLADLSEDRHIDTIELIQTVMDTFEV
jgi:hypothetical protein